MKKRKKNNDNKNAKTRATDSLPQKKNECEQFICITCNTIVARKRKRKLQPMLLTNANEHGKGTDSNSNSNSKNKKYHCIAQSNAKRITFRVQSHKEEDEEDEGTETTR
ncbi:unnamed protein product [Ceratitis capitata]|uniref:(Mediterranean fruit fly) hypothetical protein n=1 Tax=Ceratitis capitata TaxID=7213 RepID=A0A811V7L2_CERCA|nr:unnamed protein product [Ceratitis capitata]